MHLQAARVCVGGPARRWWLHLPCPAPSAPRPRCPTERPLTAWPAGEATFPGSCGRPSGEP